MTPKINTHRKIVEFGKYKGERWTRVPAAYLRWLANAPEDGINVQTAKAELDRRGTNIETEIEISPHAVDRASQHLLLVWEHTRKKHEGLYTWLARMASAAIRSANSDNPPDKITYKKIEFVFRHGRHFPILKTVIRKRGNHYQISQKEGGVYDYPKPSSAAEGNCLNRD